MIPNWRYIPSTAAMLALTAAISLQPAIAQQSPAPRAMALAATSATPSSPDPWWKHAVMYEIYPRSFQDSNGDGTGDLNGITERLDYLKDLGIDAIWIAPCYPSPQVDFGYDISDYENIDPQYGTLADFDRLLAEAKKRNIRILMDMVLNHTSDKHPWFIASASSKSDPKRDWYVWRDGKGPGQPPNNWISAFGHSAWEYQAKTGQWYYHKFYIQQPDLNWRNPAVEKAMFDSMRFWLDRGVAGFRLDAIPTLFEDPTLADEDVVKDADGKPVINAFGDITVDGKKSENLPEVHDVIRRMRAMVESYPGNRVLVGETYLPNVAELDKWYGGSKHDELQLPMDMQVGFTNKLDVALFRERINDAETKINGNHPLFVFDNHDNPRFDARYGDGVHNEAIEKMLATVLFTSRSTALMYYGDEIGMTTTTPTRKEDVKDPVGVTGWPKEKGRDGERTPMQWTSGKDAGFSTSAQTWLPLAPDYKTINVEAEKNNPDSMLNWYRKLIALRRGNAALRSGTNIMLNTSDNNVLSYLRKSANGGPDVIVACNFTAQPQQISFDLKSQGIAAKSASTLASNAGPTGIVSIGSIQLGPYGVFVGELK